jgi:hypothetical protein
MRLRNWQWARSKLPTAGSYSDFKKANRASSALYRSGRLPIGSSLANAFSFLKLKAMQATRNDDFPALVDMIVDRQKQTLWALVDGDGLTIMFPEDY